QALLGEDPLIGDVMDRKDRGRAAEERVGPVRGLQIRGDQACLPVVAVDHVRGEGNELAEFERRAAEKSEALVVVRIVLSALAIKPGPSEILLILDKIDGDRSFVKDPGRTLLDAVRQ